MNEQDLYSILKNKDRFKNIKLSKGIILKEEQRKKLAIKLFGSSIDENYVYKVNDQNVFFKCYVNKAYSNIKHNRIVNEMLCYYLAQQVGLKCAKYEPATVGDISGLISYNVVKDNEELCDFFDFSCSLEDYSISIEKVMEHINYAKRAKYNIDENQILKDLFKINIFDMLTMQTDRHASNLHLIYNEDEHSYKISPLIDNEYAFCGQALSKILNNSFDDCTLIRLLSTTKFMSLKNFEYCLSDNYMTNIQQSVEFAMKNPDKDFAKILKTFTKNINPMQAFKQLESLGYEVDRSYKIFVDKCVKYAKSCILKEMEKYDTKDQKNELSY